MSKASKSQFVLLAGTYSQDPNCLQAFQRLYAVDRITGINYIARLSKRNLVMEKIRGQSTKAKMLAHGYYNCGAIGRYDLIGELPPRL